MPVSGKPKPDHRLKPSSGSEQSRDVARIDRVRQGDRTALRALYAQYSPLLYGVALRIVKARSDADDVLQETWLHVWRRASSYNAARGTVAAWLIVVVRSRAIDRARKLAKLTRVREVLRAEPLSVAPAGVEQTASLSELRDHIEVALDSLTPKHRSILELAFFEGLSQRQIAELTGTPLGTVKYRMRRGLEQLRSELKHRRP